MLDLLPFSPTWVLVGLCVVLFYMYLVWPFSTFKKLGIPGPKPLLLFGSYLSYLKGTHVFDQECYQKYNKVFGFFEGRTPMLMVGDLDLIKEILVKKFDTFTNRRVSALPALGEFIGVSLLASTDDDWKRARSAIAPTFSSRKLKQMMVHIERCTDGFVSRLAENETHGDVSDFKELSCAVTMDIIASTAFGVDVDSLSNPDHPLVKSAKLLMDFNFFNPLVIMQYVFPQFAGLLHSFFGLGLFPQKCMNYFSEAVDNAISMRATNSNEPVDFLQLTTKAHNKDLDKNVSNDVVKRGLSMKEIKGNAVLFWLAGFETTSNALALTAYNLALHQEAQDKVIAEIDAVLKRRGKLDYEAVDELPFLEMCINETLRMFPITQRIFRICKEDTEVKGLHIPAGMIVSVPLYAIHHDADIWPEPEKFKPERFSKEEKEARDPYAFLPFGSGPRTCVGQRLAMLEMKFVLAKALEKFRFVTCDKTEIPVRINRGVVNSIKGQLWLKVEARTAELKARYFTPL